MGTFLKWWQHAAGINRFVNRAANAAAVTVIFIMMIYITADVAGRYLFSKPIPGTFEINQMLMVFVVFFGFAYTQASGSNIRAEMVVRLFPSRLRLIIEIFSHLVFLTIFLFFLVEGTSQAIASWKEREFVTGLINIPRYPARWAVAAGAFLVCLQLVFDVVDRLLRLGSPTEGDDG